MNHTTVIIIITVIISIAAWQSRPLLERLIFYPPAVNKGQYDRLLTHGFIHADGMHLLFNMFTLYFFGSVIERFYINKFGNLGFVAFYVLAIIVAILPTYARNKNNPRYSSLGASGAVSAVLFAYILFAPWNTLYLFAVLPIPAIVFAIAYVAYSIWADRRGGGNINHSAHLFGAVFGVVATIAIEPGIIFHFLNRLLNPSF
ncbi:MULTISPECIES: rhomboid family intramembrane serine protease [Moraxella]|uniref:Rhomboid family protein n=1 Tax=Moraxella catarrhalis TaxID=480 RepID=A0A198UFL4_MORCA|nr:rhomboid family intramembrane serine protease [Moraxella catarrhalis]OAU95140.1 Rhomboid family protein [Moraxella catarrhalis]OAU98955.1 Rhomboid family protein [Moraxella catarrhalis]OAU99198.1 Rhomboid family protein [Moraxella catarrhalis]OAV03907.1 Rhomboid family protein [Moraxella catarrhalis]STY82441.1 intramembrane serine protease GlpG [Moraxella catarrhalis]